jgi:hypothetical protein
MMRVTIEWGWKIVAAAGSIEPASTRSYQRAKHPETNQPL